MSPLLIIILLGGFTLMTSALKHGDSCSWSAEEYRQKELARLFATEPLKSEIYYQQNITDLKGKGYQFCPEEENLVCDNGTRTCVCGDPKMEALFGINRSLFATEEGGKCRYDLNTFCYPEDWIKNYSPFISAEAEVDLKCKMGTICTLFGQPCSELSLVLSVKHIHTSDANKPTKILKKFMTGQMCKCKAGMEIDQETLVNVIRDVLREDAADKMDSDSSENKGSGQAGREGTTVFKSEGIRINLSIFIILVSTSVNIFY